MADTQQGVRHQSARDAAGTVDTYDGDLRALFNAVATVPAGSTFNEAFMLWLQSVTGSSADNINDLAALFASQQDDTYNWSSGGPLGLPTSATWNPAAGQAVPNTFTFTRATTALVLTTTDDTTDWYQLAENSEIRLDGLRRVQNHVIDPDLSTWSTASGVAFVATRVGVGLQGEDAYEFTMGTSTSGEIRETGSFPNSADDFRRSFSVFIRAIAGAGSNIRLRIGAASGLSPDIPITSSFQRVQYSGSGTDNAGGDVIIIHDSTSNDVTIQVYKPHAQVVQNFDDAPGDYLDPTIEHLNIGVNGVSYFATTNGNTVDGNGIVTEASGTPILDGGYLPETGATKRLLHSNDLTNAVWVKNGAAGAIDLGVVNIGGQASRLTGIGTLGVDDIVQTVGGFTNSGPIAPSFSLRRISTTGTLRIVQATDGATGGDWDVDLSTIGSEWVRIEPGSPLVTENTAWTASGAGAAGVTFAASAGGPLSVDIAFANQEDGPFATTPVVTAGGAVGRAADVLNDGVVFTIDWTVLVDTTAPLVLIANPGGALVGTTSGNARAIRQDNSASGIRGINPVVPSAFGANTVTDQSGLRSKYIMSYSVSEGTSRSGITGDVIETIQPGQVNEDWSTLIGQIGSRTSVEQWRGRIHEYTKYAIATDLSQSQVLVT